MEPRNLRLMHLSQEHQAVRKFVAAIREVSTEGEPDLPAIAERIRGIFASDLEPHFIEEEHYALSMLRDAGHSALADDIFSQHEKMRAMEQAFAHPTSELLVEFVFTLEKHIELEEGVVWDILDAIIAANSAKP